VFVGIPNPNILMPVKKMRITNLDEKDPRDKVFTVLYNPQSYTRSSQVHLKPLKMVGADAPLLQFMQGGTETLNFELFFDSVSAGSEVGGTALDRLKFAGNSLLPTIAGQIDVRDYTKKITKLMHVDGDLHRPPLLKIEWASLQFKCFLMQCSQKFVRFDEQGQPVRAVLSCTFVSFRDPKVLHVTEPLNSPDTTKYHTVRQGDTLWALAAEEYGDPAEWRTIAAANGISAPRRLRTGEMLVVPALV
jgi:hypothetical protein